MKTNLIVKFLVAEHSVERKTKQINVSNKQKRKYQHE